MHWRVAASRIPRTRLARNSLSRRDGAGCLGVASPLGFLLNLAVLLLPSPYRPTDSFLGQFVGFTSSSSIQAQGKEMPEPGVRKEGKLPTLGFLDRLRIGEREFSSANRSALLTSLPSSLSSPPQQTIWFFPSKRQRKVICGLVFLGSAGELNPERVCTISSISKLLW